MSTAAEGDGAGSPGEVDVGVVVVTYNSADVVGGLLRSFTAGLRGVTWQAVFVDNASSDDTVAAITARGFDVHATTVNRGYAAAINAGIAHLPPAAAVLVLNPDVVLTPDAVATLLDALADDRVGIVVPRLVDPTAPSTVELSQRHDPSLLSSWATALLGGRLADRLAGRFPWVAETVTDPRRYAAACDTDWATGAVLLLRRDCLDAVGPWDESFFLYSEEVDYCRRARDARFVVRYTPDAVAGHIGGGGVHQPRLRAMMVVNKVRHYRRHHRSLGAWSFYAANLVGELIRSLAGREDSRAAARALLSPRRRPTELAAPSVMPR